MWSASSTYALAAPHYYMGPEAIWVENTFAGLDALGKWVFDAGARLVYYWLLDNIMPGNDIMVNKEIGPLQDAQWAIQYVREQAKEFGIDPSRLGIMVFYARGHLVSTAGTHFMKNYIDNPKNTSLRPDFMLLVYPVICFQDTATHLDSRNNLIGTDIMLEKIKEYSNELHVIAQIPPTFIVSSIDDAVVKVANSLLFTTACKQNHVPVEIFIYMKKGSTDIVYTIHKAKYNG